MAVPNARDKLVSAGDYGTLIVDGLGRIHGCGAPVEELFAAGHGRLIGRPVSALIAELFCEESSPGDQARQLTLLCTGNNWRRFEAIDTHGHGFTVEIKVSRRMTDGQAVFVFNMRRPETASCS